MMLGMVKSPRFPKFEPWFWVVSLLVLAIRALSLTWVPLSGDEAYHWEWSRTLSACYYDHPGLVAFGIRASTELFGTSLWSVRFPALVSSIVIALCVGRFTWRISKSVPITQWVLVALFAVPIWNGLGLLITTDPMFVAAALVAIACLDQAINFRCPWSWIGFGVFLGLSLFGKFLGAALVLGLLSVLWLQPKSRQAIRCWQFPVGLVLAALLFTPVLLWNQNNEWATFRFHTVVRHDAAPFPTYFIRFLASQPVLFMPILWVGWLVFGWRAWRDRANQAPTAVTLLAVGFPLLVLALLQSLRTEVGTHWTALSALAMLPVSLVLWLKAEGKARAWFHTGWASSALLVLLIHVVMAQPQLLLNSNVGYSESKSTSQVSALFGWSELGTRLDREMRQGGESGMLILNNNYAYCAVASFYTPSRPRVQQFGRPSPYGRMYQFWQKNENWVGRDALYFRDKPLTDATRRMLNTAFAGHDELEPEVVRVDGKVVRTWYIVRAYDFRVHPWQAYIDNPLLP